jgi:hypothetical protein
MGADANIEWGGVGCGGGGGRGSIALTVRMGWDGSSGWDGVWPLGAIGIGDKS